MCGLIHIEKFSEFFLIATHGEDASISVCLQGSTKVRDTLDTRDTHIESCRSLSTETGELYHIAKVRYYTLAFPEKFTAHEQCRHVSEALEEWGGDGDI